MYFTDNTRSYRFDVDEASCFYFCGHFYKALEDNFNVKGAPVINTYATK